ncbi:MAG: aromatic amino acid transport family protein [Campylobacterota bacterium]|nr:aromatic amino acid transport family protein [Campylobacterota bacterium]
MTNKHIFMLALLVAGGMIGAGILAMPIGAGIAGFWPSIVMMMFFSLSMFFSGAVLAKEVNEKRDDTFNFPSLYQEHFGVSGKWIASVANLIIFYGLLISYLVGASKIILSLFHINADMKSIVLFVIFMAFTSVAMLNIAIIKKYNTALMMLLWLAFLVLVYIGSSGIDANRFAHVDLVYLPMAAPMIIAAFVFHNIIPSICKDANYSNDIYKSIAIGLLIGFVMNTIWLTVSVGVVPEFGHISLNEARLTGVPITIEMSQILKSELFMVVGTLFAIIAIVTSYVSIGVSLKDFYKDILQNSLNIYNRWLLLVLSFIPPLIISYLFVDVFLKVLNIVGGVGIVLLFGILPTIIFYKKSSSKFALFISMVFFMAFSATLIVTVLQTIGVLHLQPAK